MTPPKRSDDQRNRPEKGELPGEIPLIDPGRLADMPPLWQMPRFASTIQPFQRGKSLIATLSCRAQQALGPRSSSVLVLHWRGRCAALHSVAAAFRSSGLASLSEDRSGDARLVLFRNTSMVVSKTLGTASAFPLRAEASPQSSRRREAGVHLLRERLLLSRLLR
eukprot:scaffold1390_cov249-Pinguiococcus_pyrenoidosus.AAC.11